jgi:hypothetical protein
MQAVIACGVEYETNEHYIATELVCEEGAKGDVYDLPY